MLITDPPANIDSGGVGMTKTSVNAAELDRMFRNAADSDTCPDDWTPVGAWIRVSSGKQDEANQVPSVIGYCVQHRYWVTRWYLVHAKSAFKGEQQEALDEAVGDMRDGNTKILVIWHSDRLERRHNREDGKSKTLPDTLAEFVDAGGRVESTLEPSLGKLDMGGQITTYVTSLMNNEKSKRISEDVKNSHDRIRANGAFGPGGLPWGYEVTGDKYNKTIRPTDVCKKYAPQIFDHCIDGDSRRTIAAWLDSENVKPKRGKKWSEGSVGHILANMTYAGRRQDLNGKTIMTCDAVIDMETFNRAKEALKSRPKRGPVKLDNRPMLASLKCARCDDSPMFRIRLKSRSGKYYFYYRCTGRGPQRKGCGNMVPFEATEYIVAVRVGMKSIKPYRPKTWIKGVNWESEMLDIEQSIRELNPRSKEDRKRRDELETLLDDYASRETVPGQWKHKDVLNADGSVQTVGEYFYGLDADGRREYLKTRDIRVEKVYADFGVGSARQPMLRIVLDGEDIGTTAITHELTETLASEIAATPPER
jgi:DNA invertase Pin-like site-specific DNA recombinase